MQTRSSNSGGGCEIGVEIALEGFEFKDLAFFSGRGSASEGWLVHIFHLVTGGFNAEAVDINCLVRPSGRR